ncbi:hypothetical protein [Methyloversatilis universalis]|uniref:hypothetical protein n=1 Tax=Methyloversatilis universalis TaxID=378211 RepID=UPI000372255D|nr:hypothetical protein [Methyloversatilis universalis]
MATLAELSSQRATAANNWQTLCAQLRAAYIELAALDRAVVNTNVVFPNGIVHPNPVTNTTGPLSSQNYQDRSTGIGRIPIAVLDGPARSFNALLELPQHLDFPLPAWPNPGDAIRARLEQLIA